LGGALARLQANEVGTTHPHRRAIATVHVFDRPDAGIGLAQKALQCRSAGRLWVAEIPALGANPSLPGNQAIHPRPYL